MDYISPFAPKIFPELPNISGLEISTGCSNMRYKNRDDILKIIFSEKACIAGVYTRSSMPSAPVDFCRESHKHNNTAKALCVNAGNANAFTGKAGIETVNNVAHIMAENLSCHPDEVFQSSTGVIGERLDGVTLGKALSELKTKSSWEDAAKAIMTTDTFAKGYGKTITLSNGQNISFTGIAKGSGMIDPNMGTMLAFIFTDAKISQNILTDILPAIADSSFNSITVDGDTSTSDTLQVFATNHGAEITSEEDIRLFKIALSDICKELALQIVKDGEGVTKCISIKIEGAENNESARKIGLSIANSPLVKTAIAGEDANWGRIVAAIGKSGEKADRDKTSISIGGVTIAENGEAVIGYDETPVAKHMLQNMIDIHVHVGIGEGTELVYTTDLTHKYIEINADYRS